ncbi:hypothetical protein RFI_16899 [Reticulomyxa filosa]|uniref:Uncharacterized protein n=1 Tax=Reticulomyxa filosa TaxID=46433 RepID=X6N3I8_RETFI|nr:hypothetical protein RFI_16899 [Reticulomyxa filosa]|eukprot:ETO20319.1 hypothetical protein RFI_16899 [Reticulomyxa filosa]
MKSFLKRYEREKVRDRKHYREKERSKDKSKGKEKKHFTKKDMEGKSAILQAFQELLPSEFADAKKQITKFPSWFEEDCKVWFKTV